MATNLTENDAERIITELFDDAWAERTTVAYNNQNFVPPDDLVAWVEYHFQFNFSSPASLGGEGNRLFRRLGRIIMMVYTKPGEGSYNNTNLATVAKNIYEGKSEQGIRFRDAHINTIGPDKGAYRQDAVVDFEYDQIK
jgi:hypothetical protein